jgi:hypothetical protein
MMLDATNDQRIKLALGKEKVPRGWNKTRCELNSTLFCKVTQQNGGQLSLPKFDKFFIEGGMLDEFCKIAKSLDTTAAPKRTDEIPFAFEEETYEHMERIYEQLRLAPGPGSFSMDLCMFMMGWLQHFFKVDNFDDVRLLMVYRANANPQNAQDVSDAITQFSRRNNQ